MINKFAKINEEQKKLTKKFENSLFLKRIYKILKNLNLIDLVLEKHDVKRTYITLIYKYYLGGNQFDRITIKIPFQLYFKKYNCILEYILSNLGRFPDLEGYEEELKNSFIYFTRENKLKIKQLNRKLNSLYCLKHVYSERESEILKRKESYIIPIYYMKDYRAILIELRDLSRFKEF